ncbi:ATP-dependent DNA helicase pif1-like [Clytia hemisphaerica]|uniref:ATP-dependent DNA helicase pif1-like n=1 Tax=Clytia hemisphaerica TaxID=252671 RepID=UPI0034D772B8
MVLLQLYMPWENENDLKGNCATFEERYFEVEEEIRPNILKHDPNFDAVNEIDINEVPVYNSSDSENSSSDENDNDYCNIHPDLIDIDYENGVNDSTNDTSSVAFTTSDRNPDMPLNLFYTMCSSFNQKQRNLFNYLFKYVLTLKHAEKNSSIDKPNPFRLFLTGGAGVGKSFLVRTLTEQMKKILKEPGQNNEKEPSVFVTASTGKAATNVDGTTLHSAFKLPIYGKGKHFKKLSGDNMHNLRLKFKHLKILLIDEISMIGEKSFKDLNQRLQEIKENNTESFGGISILLIGDFFQLPPIKQDSIYEPKPFDYTWEEFKLYELDEIVRQSGDPEFAALLNRLREGNHTVADIEKIKLLEHTDTTEWPENFMKMYITNNLKNKRNDMCLRQCDDWHKKRTSIAKDESRTKVNLNKDVPINETAGLPKELIICVGARVMLTINKDIEDKLINGSTGIVKNIQGIRNNKPSGVIYIQFDNPSSGNKLKDQRLRGELKTCVPILPEIMTFRTSDGIFVTRKQFPLIVAFATTIHKAQGSTLEYASGDLDQTTGTDKGLAPVGPGLLYTCLSRATSSDMIQLLNFKPEKHIVVNSKAIEAMEEMRTNHVLSIMHPLKEMNSQNLCLFNIRSWNLHINHFLSDSLHTSRCCLLCFTETGNDTT